MEVVQEPSQPSPGCSVWPAPLLAVRPGLGLQGGQGRAAAASARARASGAVMRSDSVYFPPAANTRASSPTARPAPAAPHRRPPEPPGPSPRRMLSPNPRREVMGTRGEHRPARHQDFPRGSEPQPTREIVCWNSPHTAGSLRSQLLLGQVCGTGAERAAS